ncbi:MAG TPA: type II toxin-antitoxin system HipA family toxin [Solirubrobacterales bacterium]|nr:type II toxin-antitoxin system HipA family toxin [Solirubrobacterales bacterium]
MKIWGRPAGAVYYDERRGAAQFQYEPDFIANGPELSPLMMPLADPVYEFREPFAGLPGLLYDSLPDRFGNALIDAWLAASGREAAGFNPIDRLCYIGSRGMGALEFVPSKGPRGTKRHAIQIEEMVELAGAVLHNRRGFETALDRGTEQAVKDLLSIGTSAGGARAKAVIAWDPASGRIRSGQVEAGPGFEHWLLKFDGVSDTREGDLADPRGYGLIEYAYSLTAVEAGIRMNPCRLMHEGGRSHFMTKRFDRAPGGGKVHMQSLSALAHLDFELPYHAYEQALATGRRLGLDPGDLEQLYRRMVFNVVARNQDDHVKNIAYLMDENGHWRLSPAFDLTYAYNPQGSWTARHQMSINGAREQITVADLRACARSASLRRTLVDEALGDVIDAVRRWPEHAATAGVPEPAATRIAAAHRLDLPRA